MGKSVAQLLCVRKRLALYFKYLLETEEPSMMAAIITVFNVPSVVNLLLDGLTIF